MIKLEEELFFKKEKLVHFFGNRETKQFYITVEKRTGNVMLYYGKPIYDRVKTSSVDLNFKKRMNRLLHNAVIEATCVYYRFIDFL